MTAIRVEPPKEIRFEGIGKPGGIAIVLDYPTKYNLRFKTHFSGDDLKLMTTILKLVGIDINDCYITFAYKNYVEKWSKKTPNTREEMLYLQEELRLVAPTKILAMGGLAHAFLNGRTTASAVRKTRGLSQWFKICDAPVYGVCTIPSYFVQSEPDLFRDLMYDVEKLATRSFPIAPPVTTYVVCKSYAQVIRELAILRKAPVVACDTETSGLRSHVDELEAIGFGALTKATSPGGNSYSVIIPMALMRDEDVKDAIYYFMSGSGWDGALVFHNAKFDLQFLAKWLGKSRPLSNLKVQDTLLMNYLLDERPIASKNSPHGLKTISRVRYDTPDYSFDFEDFWSVPAADRDWGTLYSYLCLDLAYTCRLYVDLKKEMEAEDPGLFHILNNFLLPAAVALSEVELHGAPIDQPYLEEFKKRLSADLEHNKTGMRDFLLDKGYPKDKADDFNPGSPQQVSEILYGFFRLPKPRGASETATDKDALNNAIHMAKNPDAIPFLELILEYRETTKVLGTYVKGLLEYAKLDGSVHTQFNLAGTSTGRLSANGPALQTIPQMSGPDVRRAFIAPYGYVWCKFDYSQLELRVAAYLSRDARMMQAFVDGRDIHTEVAAAMFGISPDQVTKKMRYAAKFVDFGVMYGREAESLANGRELREYNWTVPQARKFLDNYLAQFPQLRDWMQAQRKLVLAEQELKTPLGRIRRWPFLNRMEANSAQRQALNFPIQSTASDITLSALVKVHQRLHGMQSRIVVTVHDEIDVLAQWDEVIEVAKIVFECMEQNLPLDIDVPIIADMDWGKNWADLSSWDRDNMGWFVDPGKPDNYHPILASVKSAEIAECKGPFKTYSSARGSSLPF